MGSSRALTILLLVIPTAIAIMCAIAITTSLLGLTIVSLTILLPFLFLLLCLGLFGLCLLCRPSLVSIPTAFGHLCDLHTLRVLLNDL